MISKIGKDAWLIIFFLIFLFFQVDATQGAVRAEFVSQDQPPEKSLPYEVRLIRLADAKTNGYGDIPLSGLILEIENQVPNLSLVIDAQSVKEAQRWPQPQILSSASSSLTGDFG